MVTLEAEEIELKRKLEDADTLEERREIRRQLREIRNKKFDEELKKVSSGDYKSSRGHSLTNGTDSSVSVKKSSITKSISKDTEEDIYGLLNIDNEDELQAMLNDTPYTETDKRRKIRARLREIRNVKLGLGEPTETKRSSRSSRITEEAKVNGHAKEETVTDRGSARDDTLISDEPVSSRRRERESRRRAQEDDYVNDVGKESTKTESRIEPQSEYLREEPHRSSAVVEDDDEHTRSRSRRGHRRAFEEQADEVQEEPRGYQREDVRDDVRDETQDDVQVDVPDDIQEDIPVDTQEDVQDDTQEDVQEPESIEKYYTETVEETTVDQEEPPQIESSHRSRRKKYEDDEDYHIEPEANNNRRNKREKENKYREEDDEEYSTKFTTSRGRDHYEEEREAFSNGTSREREAQSEDSVNAESEEDDTYYLRGPSKRTGVRKLKDEVDRDSERSDEDQIDSGQYQTTSHYDDEPEDFDRDDAEDEAGSGYEDDDTHPYEGEVIEDEDSKHEDEDEVLDEEDEDQGEPAEPWDDNDSRDGDTRGSSLSYDRDDDVDRLSQSGRSVDSDEYPSRRSNRDEGPSKAELVEEALKAKEPGLEGGFISKLRRSGKGFEQKQASGPEQVDFRTQLRKKVQPKEVTNKPVATAEQVDFRSVLQRPTKTRSESKPAGGEQVDFRNVLKPGATKSDDKKEIAGGEQVDFRTVLKKGDADGCAPPVVDRPVKAGKKPPPAPPKAKSKTKKVEAPPVPREDIKGLEEEEPPPNDKKHEDDAVEEDKPMPYEKHVEESVYIREEETKQRASSKTKRHDLEDEEEEDRKKVDIGSKSRIRSTVTVKSKARTRSTDSEKEGSENEENVIQSAPPKQEKEETRSGSRTRRVINVEDEDTTEVTTSREKEKIRTSSVESAPVQEPEEDKFSEVADDVTSKEIEHKEAVAEHKEVKETKVEDVLQEDTKSKKTTAKDETDAPPKARTYSRDKIGSSKTDELKNKLASRSIGQKKNPFEEQMKKKETTTSIEQRMAERRRQRVMEQRKKEMQTRTNRMAFKEQLEKNSPKPTNMAGKGPLQRTNSNMNKLLNWAQRLTSSYEGVDVVDFSGSWADGLAFCALMDHFAPNKINFYELDPKDKRKNLELAFSVAAEEGVPELLEADDFMRMRKPDPKCVATYLNSVYQILVAERQ